MPHSEVASAPQGVASAATPEQLSMPHSAAASALVLPRQALDQARHLHQVRASTTIDETQIEASDKHQGFVSYGTEMKRLQKCISSPKRQCSLPDICTEMMCSLVC